MDSKQIYASKKDSLSSRFFNLEIKEASLIMALSLVLCVFAYDLYYPVVGRVFDLIAVLALFAWYFYSFGFRVFRAIRAPALLCLTLVGIYLLRGGEIRHLTGLLLMVTFFYLYRQFFERYHEHCWLALQIASIAIAFTFFVQLAAFELFGHVLDISSAAGSIPSRIFILEMDYFRASSIYQEPNSYCVFAFIVSSLLIAKNRIRQLERFTLWLMIVTMIMSNSLWGMALGGLVTLFACIIRHIRISSAFFTSLIAFLLLSSPVWFQERTGYRILNIASESTVIERYIGSRFGPVNHKEYQAIKTDEYIDSEKMKKRKAWGSFFLGNGISSIGFQRAYGANGWSYLLYNFGVVGFLFFVAATLIYDKSKYHIGAISLFFLLTSFPYFTYAVFPLFLVMLFEEKQG